MQTLHKIAFAGEPDLVHVRRVARRLAQLLGFDPRDEVKITAAVSELTRAAKTSTEVGAVELGFSLQEEDAVPRLVVDVAGPGLALAARARGTPAAEGVVAAEKLLERIGPAAPSALRFGKPLPLRVLPIARDRMAAIRAELERMDTPRKDQSREELLHQSQDLTGALLDLEERKQELTTLNSELSDTNRGVMALYAELEERAEHLRRAGELKTRFFSHMSHEFRTPLNSMLALTNMLLDESDGPLLDEQRRQVRLIRDGVADLLELVGDLLDLAKMEAGATRVNVSTVAVGTLFGALRAMIRPLLGQGAVALEFASAAELPPLQSDETKITQILRNFLSNAVKFTERGTIAVSARLVSAGEENADFALDGESVLFAVADTGIGIAAAHHDAIFQDYQQVENRLQRKSRGTGLGLPLCRRLAGLLGGRVWVESALGQGATFYLQIPRVHAAALTSADAREGHRLLIVDERADRRAAIAAAFRGSAFVPVEVSADELAAASLATLQPTAALLDVATAAPAALEALRAAALPLVDVRAADLPIVSPERLVAEANKAVLRAKLPSIVVLDDDEAYRTILTKHLAPFCERVSAFSDAQAVLAATGAHEVDCLVLDLIMPDVDGLTLLQRIRGNAAMTGLPVVVCSSKALSGDEVAVLHRLRASFLPKDALTPTPIARALLDACRLAASASAESAGRAA
jgi:signal transduction histidine kinase/CheY-like chemotaxis protein